MLPLQYLTAKIMNLIITLLLSVLIIAIAIVFLAIRIIIKKNGTFKSQHIHDNPYLRNKGINCVIEQDKEARLKEKAF